MNLNSEQKFYLSKWYAMPFAYQREISKKYRLGATPMQRVLSSIGGKSTKGVNAIYYALYSIGWINTTNPQFDESILTNDQIRFLNLMIQNPTLTTAQICRDDYLARSVGSYYVAEITRKIGIERGNGRGSDTRLKLFHKIGIYKPDLSSIGLSPQVESSDISHFNPNRTQRAILEHYCNHPFATYEEIAQSLGVNRPTICTNISNMALELGESGLFGLFYRLAWIETNELPFNIEYLPRHEKILDYLRVNPLATHSEISYNLGSVSFHSLKKYFNEIYMLNGLHKVQAEGQLYIKRLHLYDKMGWYKPKTLEEMGL